MFHQFVWGFLSYSVRVQIIRNADNGIAGPIHSRCKYPARLKEGDTSLMVTLLQRLFLFHLLSWLGVLGIGNLSSEIQDILVLDPKLVRPRQTKFFPCEAQISPESDEENHVGAISTHGTEMDSYVLNGKHYLGERRET